MSGRAAEDHAMCVVAVETLVGGSEIADDDNGQEVEDIQFSSARRSDDIVHRTATHTIT